MLSLATLVVVAGIVALSTGAQKNTDKPAEAPKATAPAAAKPSAPAAPTAASAAKAPAETPATPAKDVTAAAEEPEAAVAEAKTPSPEEVAAYLEGYGWMVGQQAGFEMGFTSDEKDAIMRGLERAASGEKAPENMKEIFPKMQEYLSAKEKTYRANMMAKMAEEAKVHNAEGEKFLADVAKQPGVQKSASGLYYKIEVPGTGKQPAGDDVVSIHYTGKLTDGTVFDSSVERGASVDLPLYGVIPGFSEGLQLLKEGGKATLYIPSSLGYGNQAAGPIPAGSTLVFYVELIKVQPKQAPAAEAVMKDGEVTKTAEVKPETKTEVKPEAKAEPVKTEAKAQAKADAKTQEFLRLKNSRGKMPREFFILCFAATPQKSCAR